jgi:hypothetical protein
MEPAPSPKPPIPSEYPVATAMMMPSSVESEAKRIAHKLVELYHSGAIKEPVDASFFAHLLRDFDATYTGPVSKTDADDPAGPYVPTKQQHVRVPRGLTMEERQRFLQKDLEDAIGYVEDIVGLPPIFASRKRCR